MKTLLTTENISLIELINSEYFNNSLDVNGTVGDITKFVNKGIFYITLTVKNTDNITLLLFDNLSLTRIKVREGVNHIYTEIKSNSWGFLLIPNDINTSIISTVNINKISPIITPPFLVSAWTIGDVTIDVLNANCTLNTNKGRSISIVSEALFNDRNYLREFGVEASAVEINNLPNGVYQCDVKRGIYDINNNDSLYLYNGRNFSKISDTLVEQKRVEFEILYGYINMIAIDVNKTSGATEFIINNVQRLRDLNYFPPQKMSLIPNSQLGRVINNKSGTIISTGTGSRAISSIVDSLNLQNIPIQIYQEDEFIIVDDLSKSTFTEGSYGLWDFPNGEYLIQWTFKTGESVDSTKADAIYFYDGKQLQLLGNIQVERTANNQELIEVRNGKLGIIVLDEKDKLGTTEIKITKIEQTKLESELPPLEENNSDENSDEPWDENEKIIDPVNQEINFTFGGDITAYRSTLILTENKQLTVSIDKPVIVEISASNAVIYSQEYTTELTVTLLEGEYRLNLFTESSIEEDYLLTLNTVFFDEFEPIFSEPPHPIIPTLKNLGNDFNTAFDFGTLKPWENDTNSGLTWNQGYVYPSGHLGHSSINNLVKENKVDYCTFTLNETCYLNLFHRDVMVTILDENGILTSSNNNHHGQLQLQLEAGKYYLSLAGGNGNNSVYFVSIYLSNLDPNYAD